MTVKEYLNQVRMLDIKIKNELEELNHLRELSTSLGGFSFEEKVQTSKATGDTIGIAVGKIIDLQRKINNDIVKLKKTRNKILDDIEKVEDINCYDLLYKRYVLYKTREEIAVDMNYSIRKIYYLHGEALKKIQAIKSLQ